MSHPSESMIRSRQTLISWAKSPKSDLHPQVIALFEKISTNSLPPRKPSPAALLVVDIFIAIQELKTKTDKGFFSEKEQRDLGLKLEEVLDLLIENYKQVFTTVDLASDSSTGFAITNDLSVVTQSIKCSLYRVIEIHEFWDTIQDASFKTKFARRPLAVKAMQKEIDKLVLFISSIPSQSRLVILPKAEYKAEPNVVDTVPATMKKSSVLSNMFFCMGSDANVDDRSDFCGPTGYQGSLSSEETKLTEGSLISEETKEEADDKADNAVAKENETLDSTTSADAPPTVATPLPNDAQKKTTTTTMKKTKKNTFKISNPFKSKKKALKPEQNVVKRGSSDLCSM